VAWITLRLAVAELAGTHGMGSVVLGMIVDVDVAGSGLEPKVSLKVRFLDLPNFFKRRFISLDSGARWAGMMRRKTILII